MTLTSDLHICTHRCVPEYMCANTHTRTHIQYDTHMSICTLKEFPGHDRVRYVTRLHFFSFEISNSYQISHLNPCGMKKKTERLRHPLPEAQQAPLLDTHALALGVQREGT